MLPLVRDLITKDAVQVPPYPGIAMRLQRLVSDGKYDTHSLSKLVTEDQVLTAAVLRAANSAANRGVAPISALPAAIARIGSEELCRVALAAGLGKVAAADGALASLRRAAWRQGMVTAIVCHRLAPLRGLHPQEAFACGLLHDFGKLVGVAALETLLATHGDRASRPIEIWVSLLDELHVELGLVTAARWKLSDLLCAVMSSHHRPELAGVHRPMVDLVMAADAVAAVLETCPCVLDGDLPPMPHVKTQQELAALMQVLPLIPTFIASLDECAPPEPAKAVSQVESPPTILRGQSKQVDMPVVWLRASAQLTMRARWLNLDGIAVLSQEALRENNLVRLRVAIDGGEPLELCAKVVMCKKQGDGHLAELQFFALSGDPRRRWESLFRQAAA